MNHKALPIIHIGKIQVGNKKQYLLLRQVEPYRYAWFQDDQLMDVLGGSVADAILAARKYWSLDHFETVHCGFRFTLPERDEHGINALFSEMAASYNSMNGIYFDPDLSHNCFVQSASLEARDLLKKYGSTL